MAKDAAVLAGERIMERRAEETVHYRATEAQIELDRAKAEFFRWAARAMWFLAAPLGVLLWVHVVAIVAVVE